MTWHHENRPREDYTQSHSNNPGCWASFAMFVGLVVGLNLLMILLGVWFL